MNTLIDIHPIRTLKDNYVWALIDNKRRTAVIIDPGEHEPVIEFLNQRQISLISILITHHHWDHTNGIAGLLNSFNVPIFGSFNEKIANLTNPMREGMQVNLPGFPVTLSILEIPGHTLGHIAYTAPGMVFTGDTLFGAGCGRLFEGTAAQMLSSLQKLAALPDDTNVYCGHEYTLNNLRFAQIVEPTNEKIAERIERVTELVKMEKSSLPSTMKEEKETNPFLRCDSPDVVASVEAHVHGKLDNKLAVFTALRKWKDEF